MEDKVMRSVFLTPEQNSFIKQISYDLKVTPSEIIGAAIENRFNEWSKSDQTIKQDLENIGVIKTKHDVGPGYPCLYVLVRTDLASMTAGRVAAQTTHAANKFVYDVRLAMDHQPENYRYFDELLHKWQDSRGFGTCIVLDAGNERALHQYVEQARNAPLFAGIIHDPTYAIRDGEVTHVIPVNTCAYVFGMKSKCAEFLSNLSLYNVSS